MINYSITPRLVAATASVFLDPAYYALFVRIGYASSSHVSNLSEDLDRPSQSRSTGKIVDFDNVNLSFTGDLRLKEIGLVEGLVNWQRGSLFALPPTLEPVFTAPQVHFGGDDRMSCDGCLRVTWDQNSAQLALQASADVTILSWHEVADGLAIGLGDDGAFGEWRLTAFHDDPDATWSHLSQ